MRTLCRLTIAVAISAGLAGCKSDKHRDVTIEWADVRQTIDGFGASSAFFGDRITDEIADKLFDAKKGIGLSLLRIMIGLPDDTNSDGSGPTDNPNPTASAPEIETAKQALARGAKVWATAWTPPPLWKTTNSKNGKGDGFEENRLKPEHYQDYADYLAAFFDALAQEQVELMALSPANEPDYIASWDGAQWTPQELTTFIGQNLGPTFAQRFPDVKIVSPDTASWPNVDKYVSAMLADPAAREHLDVVATHPYTNSSAKIDLDYDKPGKNGKQFWQTEWSQENMNGDTPNPTMSSAIDMMKRMHDHLVRANMTAWNWWSIYISADALAAADVPKVRQNPALIQPDATMGESYMFKRGYSLGHWSRFVRPGFQRIGATDKPTGGVLVEAYRDNDSHIVVTAINTTSKVVTQKFKLEGGSFGTLTPWVTSPADDMAAKDPISPLGETFVFDLPAESVVTFVNWDANAETPHQGTLPVFKHDAATDARPTTGGLDCANAMVPNNLVEGGVTDFSDWKSQKWGDSNGLWGYMYSYKGPAGSTMAASIDASAKTLHATGSLVPGDYIGVGLSFGVCTTVTSFTHVQFTAFGSWAGCDLEMQIKTFDQQPISQNPAGGCFQDASAGCYNFPAAKQVALSSGEPVTVVVPLDTFSNWSTENAGQVVGLQWQFTTPAPEPDAGTATSDTECPVDLTIGDIKFVLPQAPETEAGAPEAGAP